MLYRTLSAAPGGVRMAERAQHAPGGKSGSVGRPAPVTWVRGERAEESCPVCSDRGPHQIVLTVASSIRSGEQITFARCRRCDCKFVTGYRQPAYEAAPASDAPLRFYVEQGAGLDVLARSVFVAGQIPVRKYLDVGCGFGFGPDLATRIFGWDARGLDPGPLAAAGREMLGVRIESGMLSSETRLADAPYDAIAAMEIIEHITAPHDFLRAVRNNLADTGILVLSTPNGRYLDTCPNGGMLLPILSPGYHAVLYTAEGLSTLLRGAGFAQVAVTQTAASLFAVASPASRVLRPEIGINRSQYLGYLRSRFRDAAAGSPIHVGFGYRLLRSLTEDGTTGEALDVFADLRDALLAHLAIDIAKPLDLAGSMLGETISFADVPGRYPFCLAGLLFCRGTIAADHERDTDMAAGYFLAARFAAQTLLRALNAIGISDGELAALPDRAADALRCLFGSGPTPDGG